MLFFIVLFLWPLNSVIPDITGSADHQNQLPAEESTENPISTVIFSDVAYAEDDYESDNEEETAQEQAKSDTQILGLATIPDTSTKSFSIEIPSIHLIHSVTPDVDPVSKDEYLSILERSIAHGKGTSYPNDPDGNTYLFAHSKKRYDGINPENGLFTRIDELTTGDKITVEYNGKTYKYSVVDKFVVDPDEVSVYTYKSPYDDSNSLTLQTCYPRGEMEKRLIVRAIGE